MKLESASEKMVINHLCPYDNTMLDIVYSNCKIVPIRYEENLECPQCGKLFIISNFRFGFHEAIEND